MAVPQGYGQPHGAPRENAITLEDVSWAQTNLASVDVSPDDFIGLFDNPGLLLGIPLVIAGAVFMSFGAQYQSRGVRKVEAIAGATGKKRAARIAPAEALLATFVG